MSDRRWLRLGTKALHEIASIAFGGGLAACLVINLVADRASPAAFAAARDAFDAIARYVLVPSMAVVVVSGLLALAATRGYLGARWAWLKALLGLSVFEATLLVVGSGRRQAELAAAAATDAGVLDDLLRSERHTLWLLLVLSVINVVLAVWRPRLAGRERTTAPRRAPDAP
jgi:uncharacterized membrane protein